jgi:hypothetical protein
MGKTKPIIKTNPIKRAHPHISQCQGILIEFVPDELGTSLELKFKVKISSSGSLNFICVNSTSKDKRN